MPRHGPEEGSQNNLSDDIGWNFATMATNRHNAVCKFCKKLIKGGITRVKEHLAGKRGNVTPCPDVPREVREQMIKHLQESKDKRKDKQKMREELEFHLNETVVRDPRYVDLDDDSDSDPEMTFARRKSVTQYQFEESHKRKSVHVHTHLKKRLKNNQISQDTKKHSNAPMEFKKESSVDEVSSTALFSQLESKTSKFINLTGTPRLGLTESPRCAPVSSQHSKGPWTLEEDQILISYIEQNGHGDWRALPKLAGLLRSGKSCRLRWTNYLRPDIKRGYFSKEEEETIIKLHEMLGNRWSAIAARLPGRTDNEIKNFWHTHLKKRLTVTPRFGLTVSPRCAPVSPQHSGKYDESFWSEELSAKMQSDFPGGTNTGTPSLGLTESPRCAPVSPQHSCSGLSTVTDSSAMTMITNNNHEEMDHSSKYFSEIDEYFSGIDEHYPKIDESFLSPTKMQSDLDNDMDFWYDVWHRGEESSELPKF